MSSPSPNSPGGLLSLRGTLKTLGKVAIFGMATIYAANLLFKDSFSSTDGGTSTTGTSDTRSTEGSRDGDQIEGKQNAELPPKSPIKQQTPEGAAESKSNASPVEGEASDSECDSELDGDAESDSVPGSTIDPPAVEGSVSVPPLVLRLAILSPTTLNNYANLLHAGFQSLSSSPASPILFDRLDLYTAESQESPANFAQRVRSNGIFYDILLIQLHGSHMEVPIAFENFQSSSAVSDSGAASKVLLLLHRPEEILERHWQRLYSQNLHSLLGRSDAAILLGNAMRKVYVNICSRLSVIPHGFSQLDYSIIDKPKSIDQIACIGSITSFSEMRWISDVVHCHSQYLKLKARSGHAGSLMFFIAGSFTPFVNIANKQKIDELAWFKARQNQFSIEFITESTLSTAFEAGKFHAGDVDSFKRFLFELSGNGAKIVLLEGFIEASRSPALHTLAHSVIDFQFQLYRELLKDFKPKCEYSGSLHAFPGLALPIVFESAAMNDIATEEGLQMITVKWNGAASNQTQNQENLKSPAKKGSNAADSAPSSSSSLPFPSSYYPDFTAMLQRLFMLQQNGAQFDAQRRKCFENAKSLDFTEVARRYATLFRDIKQTQDK